MGRIPLFERCSTAELREIAGLAIDVDVSAGQVLCTQGQLGHELFILVEGEAIVAVEARSEVVIGPGDFVGELALLDDVRRTATVTMASAGSMLVMAGTDFRGLLRSAPTIAVGMLPVLAARLRASDAN